MNHDAIVQEVIQLLRRTLSGSSREINVDDPLGELGLGLDSLTLIEFVTVLENRFQVVIPESIWTEKGQLSLRTFVDVIAAGRPSAAEAPEVLLQKPPVVQAGERPSSEISAPVPAASKPLLRSRLDFMRQKWHSIYNTDKFFILEFDLGRPVLPKYSSSLPLDLRRASITDAPALETFWNSFNYLTIDRQKMDMELFQQRLASGFICLTAYLGAQIVGMDWLVQNSYDCPYTGLRFDWPAGSCYAGELYEHPAFRGKGIGLAVLAFSLEESKRAGFHRQVAWVAEKNVKMLSASIQLFGFRIIGEIHIKKILRKPISRWKIGDRQGWGGTVMI